MPFKWSNAIVDQFLRVPLNASHRPVTPLSHAACFAGSDARRAVDVLELVRAFDVLFVGGQEDYIGASIMMATDALLFGIVLLIFAYAIAFGFVIQLSEANRQRLPAWMQIEGVTELKITLVQVILVYLIVDFATDISEPDTEITWQTLVMPIAILLIAGALRLMSRPLPHPNGSSRF